MGYVEEHGMARVYGSYSHGNNYWLVYSYQGWLSIEWTRHHGRSEDINWEYVCTDCDEVLSPPFPRRSSIPPPRENWCIYLDTLTIVRCSSWDWKAGTKTVIKNREAPREEWELESFENPEQAVLNRLSAFDFSVKYFMLAIILFLYPAYWFWFGLFRRWRWGRGNRCLGCGYSLVGVVAARCPECGRGTNGAGR